MIDLIKIMMVTVTHHALIMITSIKKEEKQRAAEELEARRLAADEKRARLLEEVVVVPWWWWWRLYTIESSLMAHHLSNLDIIQPPILFHFDAFLLPLLVVLDLQISTRKYNPSPPPPLLQYIRQGETLQEKNYLTF